MTQKEKELEEAERQKRKKGASKAYRRRKPQKDRPPAK